MVIVCGFIEMEWVNSLIQIQYTVQHPSPKTAYTIRPIRYTYDLHALKHLEKNLSNDSKYKILP